MGQRALIFCWHNVAPTQYFRSNGTDATEGFRRQMRFLQTACTPISLTDAVSRFAEGRPLPPRAAVVTFDDGYRDNLQVAAPILARLQIPATFFLVPRYLSCREAPWWELLAWAIRSRRRTGPVTWGDLELDPAGSEPDAPLDVLADRLKSLDESARQRAVAELIELFDPAGDKPPSPMMDWDEARQLALMGFDIGSHSYRHVILSNEPAGNQLEDLRQSRNLLEKGVGATVDLLAYPNGRSADFGPATVASARQAGYRAAVTTIDGWNDPGTDPFLMRRFVISPEWGPIGFAVIARHVARSARRHFRSTVRVGARPGPSRTANATR